MMELTKKGLYIAEDLKTQKIPVKEIREANNKCKNQNEKEKFSMAQ